MPVTAPPTLTAAGLSPDRADRATFVARSIARDDFIKNTQIPQLQTAIDNVFNNAKEAYNSGVSATADAASSAINASQAAAAAAAIQWVSGTNYAVGDPRWSPITKISYRRLIAGAGTTDPNADATNWAAIVMPLLAGGTGATTAAAARTALDIKQLQSIDYTLAGNALTLKLNPTNLDFRSTTFTNGVPVNITNAAQLTTTISSGSTGGTVSGVQSDIILLAINNAGTMELAWTNLAGGLNLDENGLINTVAEGGAGAADSANVIYSTTTRTSVAYRVVGVFRSTQITAGTWAQIPALVQGVGGQALISRKIVDAAIPAFGAYQSAAQAIAPATFTKVQLQTEEYDTTNAFDNITNFRFTPLVAGYYQVSGRTAFAAGQVSHICSIYKNGISHKRGAMGALIASTVASLVLLNGTTDYVELYIYQASGASQNLVIAGEETYFNATLAKAT